MNNLLTRSAVAAVFFAVALGAGIAAKTEIAVELHHGTRAYSLRSDHIILSDCLAQATRITARLLPKDQRRDLLRHCETVTNDILLSSPRQAFGWYCAAYFRYSLGDNAGFNAALHSSYLNGKSEVWLARLRIALAARGQHDLSSDNSNAQFADISLVLGSKYVEEIATRYIQDADFRPLVTTILPQQPIKVQSTFLSALKQKMRGNSGE